MFSLSSYSHTATTECLIDLPSKRSDGSLDETLGAEALSQTTESLLFADAETVGRAPSATSARSTRRASTARASCRGSATVRKAGEACCATKVRIPLRNFDHLVVIGAFFPSDATKFDTLGL